MFRWMDDGWMDGWI
jgi:hypothetical protein